MVYCDGELPQNTVFKMIDNSYISCLKSQTKDLNSSDQH